MTKHRLVKEPSSCCWDRGTVTAVYRALSEDPEAAMFVHEFLRGIIRSNMEDPVERDARAHDHMYKVKATADKL